MVGVSLYYESIGAGETLLLIHAGIADSRMWDQQVEEFSKHYRVIRLDVQGFGKSPAAEQPVTRAQELCDLLRSLDVERAHVVGVSMGGAAAIDFAVQHPEMVGALIPVAAGVSGFEDTAHMVNVERPAEFTQAVLRFLQEAAASRGAGRS